MRKPLKLKKIKISRVDNLHTILAGALPAQGAQQHRITDYDLCGDTKIDGDCAPKTNGDRTLSRTGIPYGEPVNSGIQN